MPFLHFIIIYVICRYNKRRIIEKLLPMPISFFENIKMLNYTAFALPKAHFRMD